MAVMVRGWMLPLIAILLCRPLTAAEEDRYQSTILENGLELVLLPGRNTPVVILELVFRYGANVQVTGQNGWTQLHAQMFFRSQKESPSQFSYRERARELGIEYSSLSREEWTAVLISLADDSLAAGLEFLLRTVRQPLLDKDEIAQERAMLLERMDQLESATEFQLRRAADHLLWGSSYRRQGRFSNRESLDGATVEQLRLLQMRYIIPNNALLIVAGDIAREEAVAQVEEIFGAWERGYDPFRTHPLPGYIHLMEDRDTVLIKPVASAEIFLSWQGPGYLEDPKGVSAASVCAALLNLRAGRFQSRLVTNGPLLQATASYHPQRSIGPFTIRATALMENAQQAVALLQAEIDLLADTSYFSRRDYEHASAGLQVQVASWKDDIWIEVGQMAAGWALAGLDYVDSYPDSLQAVTPADVRKCLSNYLIGQPLVTALMVDEGTGKSIILREVQVP